MALFEFHIHGDNAETQNKLNKIMATLQEFEAALQRIDTATTNIATQLTELRDQIAGAGLPAEQEATVLSRLTSLATQLESMAQTPENPTPETPTPPTE